MSIEKKDVFVWDKMVCPYDSIIVGDDTFELSISNGGHLYLLNKNNGEKGILRKELINNGAFNRPRLLGKGGFCLILKPEACEEIGNVIGQLRGLSIEPNKKDKEAFDKLEGLARILYRKGVRISF